MLPVPLVPDGRTIAPPLSLGQLDVGTEAIMPDNGIVERLHRTLLDEHFRVEGRKTWFETIEEMQTVLDAYLISYNTRRPHQGRGMNGRTPAKAFRDGIPRNSKKEDKIDLMTAA